MYSYTHCEGMKVALTEGRPVTSFNIARFIYLYILFDASLSCPGLLIAASVGGSARLQGAECFLDVFCRQPAVAGHDILPHGIAVS